jgi:hypothetical protein
LFKYQFPAYDQVCLCFFDLGRTYLNSPWLSLFFTPRLSLLPCAKVC